MPAILQDRHFKTLKRALLKNRVSQGVCAALLAGVIFLVFVASRKKNQLHPEAEPYIRGEKNALFTFWHGRMMVLPAFCPPKRKMRILISRHRDGLLISRVIRHFGQATVSGSSGKDGAAAVKEVLRTLKAGDNIGITPDGPRGPFQTVSKGTMVLARLSGVPILPVSFSATRKCFFSSWDRFCFALPFGTITFVAGEPFAVPREATPETMETLRLRLEQIMQEQASNADHLCGAAA